jgi:hypothetical protein
MGNATLTIRFELEPGDEDAMYRLESMLLSDPAWRAGIEQALACALADAPGGEWAVRMVRLDDERGTNVWRFVVE